jgi:3-methyladenine DNA glycosylase AlkC
MGRAKDALHPPIVQNPHMATPLKDSFGSDVPRRIAESIAAVRSDFPVRRFLVEALDGYEDLELLPRGRQIARALNAHLPADYDESIEILLAALDPLTQGEELTGMAAFILMPHVFFVAEYGLNHWETSMKAQYELTQRFTAEYSIRAFLEREPERTLERLREWARDPSPDVRRLVSEGTRPRLPWAPRLRRFLLDPSPVLELLELLKDDESLYVRRSVANNLNDIGKDHPALLITTCRRWTQEASQERRWLIRHALRSAIKRGDRAALEVLGFGARGAAEVDGMTIEPRRPSIGESIRFTFTLRNSTRDPAAFNVDLRVHFVKANGGTSPKVFRVRELILGPGERRNLSKLVSVRQQTTRTHHPGRHDVEVVVNGATVARDLFNIAG